VLQRNNLSPQRVILVEQMLLSAVSRHVSARKKWPDHSMMRCAPNLANTRVVTLRYARGHARVMALVPLGYPNVLGLD
jgi:hypothetical protein